MPTSALNALDELLPGPDDRQLEAEAPPAPRGRVMGSRRSGAFNMLDELLPGPEHARPEPPPLPLRLSRPEGTEREPARVVPLRASGAAGALDAFLAGAPAPPSRRSPRQQATPTRVRTTFKVSTEVLRAVREAIGRMSAEQGNRMTLDELTERALAAELKRMARRRRAQARRAAERAERAAREAQAEQA
jgi:hypothetical protein